MNTVSRYIFLIVLILLGFHFILSLTHQGYGRATSLRTIFSTGRKPNTTIPDIYYVPKENCQVNTHPSFYDDKRANATIVMLARNSDLDFAVRSIRELEDRFNRKYQYPYTFLNEEEFSEEFKTRMRTITTANIEFGLIPHDHWFQPDWINEEKASASRKKMEEEGVIYGGSLPYRNMCRYNSGFFYLHPLMLKYKWYWRVEPDVHFTCDIDFDPFLFMEGSNKTYGFTLTLYEFDKTIPTLWNTVKDFMREHPEAVAKGNAMGWMSDNDGVDYNRCHFWSNFEIADMEFWRSPVYTSFFEYLDKTGGFYYERWGDAPVHSIAASLFLPKENIHFFENIGYEHNPYNHCPQNEEMWKRGKCACNRGHSFDYDGYSCLRHWESIW